ncbi:MAG: MBL fold metallo-hydrolase RNA specificity domain-containing protein [Candidatus Woesearchaeota archaeon]|jgi:ribonuclease J
MIKIHTLGGYNEIGKNMTAVEVDGEFIILDMGLHLEPYAKYQDTHGMKNLTKDILLRIGAVPDDSSIPKDKVVAIIPSHAHLDHIGAIPFLEFDYRAPIICTSFAKEVLTKLAQDVHVQISNPVIVLKNNKSYKTKNTTIELIHVTHSVIQAVIIAITTKYGTILYANDFKIDKTPTLGEKTDSEKLKKYKVLALICDCIKADTEEPTPSEAVAKQMLDDLFDTHDFTNKTVVISTFSSHIARLQSILVCAKKINRKILFLGRSLAKYVEAAAAAEGIEFKEVELLKYGDQIRKELKKIIETRHEYLIVATGHQGEPSAVLAKLVANQLPLKLISGDVVIFSSTVIPNEENIKNRGNLVEQLEQRGVTVFKDVHVSGHASRNDLKEFLTLTNPTHIIPAQGPKEIQAHLISIAKELGYDEEYLHYSENGDSVNIIIDKQKSL